jgi:succinoglycan biosynthesis transport protein ExoP
MKAVRDEGLVLSATSRTRSAPTTPSLQRFTQTSLESQTTQSNVNLLTRPTADGAFFAASRAQPAAGAVRRAAAGVGLALLLELRDRRVRNVDDLIGAGACR